MNSKTIEIATKIISTHNKKLFKRFSKSENKDPAIFAIEYFKSRVNIRQELKQKIGREQMLKLEESSEIHALVFFGVGNSIKGTHNELKNNNFFWSLFGYHIKKIEYPMLNYKNIINSTLLNNRLLTPQSDRSYASYTIYAWEEVLVRKMRFYAVLAEEKSVGEIFNEIKKDLLDHVLSVAFNMVDTSDKKIEHKMLYVYRGFDIHTNEYVRKGKFKVKNNNYMIQDAGVGISYTLNYETAYDFALHKISMHDQVDTKSSARAKNSPILFDLNNLNIMNFTNRDSRRCYIGKFLVDSKDIIINLSKCAEPEIVIDPSSTRLLNYKQVNYYPNI